MERKHDLTSVAIPAKLKPDAVPDSVTEHGYPLAQHYNLTVRRDVEFLEKMKMTEYEIIDTRIIFPVFFRKRCYVVHHPCSIFFRRAFDLAAVTAPAICERNCPAWMYCRKSLLTRFITEQSPEKSERWFKSADSISVGH